MGGLFPKPVPEVMTMSLLFAATLSAVFLTQISWAAAVEEVAMLRSSDRQKILVEGAKKEGKLSFYTTLIVDQVVRPLKEAFEKEYPFVQRQLRSHCAETCIGVSGQEICGGRRRRDHDHDFSTAGRIRAEILLTSFGRISGGAQRCSGLLGRRQSLFPHSWLQHENGQAE